MLASMGAGLWLGRQLDAYLQLEFPLFLCLLTLGSTVGVLYGVIKSLARSSKGPPEAQ